MIVRVNVVLNRTIVVDSVGRFDNLCVSHLHSQSELYHVLNDGIKLWFIISKFQSLRILTLGLWKLNGFVSRNGSFPPCPVFIQRKKQWLNVSINKW